MLLLNIFLLSFYVVAISAEFIPCKSKSGRDISAQYLLLFNLCTVVLALDTFNSAVPCIYFRMKLWNYNQAPDGIHNFLALSTLSEITEWLFRFLVGLMTVVQRQLV